MKTEKIKEWLDIACKCIFNPGDSQDIHINEFINIEPNDKEQIVQDSLILANYIRTHFLDIVKEDCRLYLYIALNSDSNSILGVPRSYNSLLNRIDTSYPPELVLYKEFGQREFNKVELYKSCLPFEIKCNDSIDLIYRELRSFDELVDNAEYTRELHLIIK